MSVLTQAILEEIENLNEDIARAEKSGADASHFQDRKKLLTKRLSEANEQLQSKQLLKG